MMADQVSDAKTGLAPSAKGRATRIRILYLLPVLVFLALSLLLLVRLYSGDPSRLPSALLGRPVPAFALGGLPGLKSREDAVPGLSDADLKTGHVTVVNVWASWCAPCRQEHPLLMELGRGDAFRLVGIDYKDDPENARRFLGALGNPFAAVGLDQNGRAAIDWGVYGVPETFVVDGQGIIRHKHVGPLTPEALPGFTEKVREAARQ